MRAVIDDINAADGNFNRTHIDLIISEFKNQLGEGIVVHHGILDRKDNQTPADPTTSVAAAADVAAINAADTSSSDAAVITIGGGPSENKTKTQKTTDHFEWMYNAKRALIVLSSNRKYANYEREFCRECNGVVIEYPSFKLAGMPPQSTSLNCRMNQVEKNFSKYKVYKIVDGSMVTLYYQGQWFISSANGYDVSEYKWLSDKTTYRQAIMSLLGDKLETMDKTHSYTICFRHHDFHPFLVDPAGIWLIQEYDVVNNMVVESPTLNIPRQLPITITAAEITYRCANARQAYLATGAIDYGYILRGDCGSQSNILIESNLLSAIRLSMYNLPKGANSPRFTSPQERLTYMVMSAFLNKITKKYFLKLFPQFGDQFKSYDNMIRELKLKVMTYIRNPSAHITGNPRTAVLVVKLGSDLKKAGVNICNTDAQSIIMDYLYQQDRVLDYYTYIMDLQRKYV
jgi:hypothetical protein